MRTKRSLALLLSPVAALVFSTAVLPPASAAPSAAPRAVHALAVTQWEYATVPLPANSSKETLDSWGADGWELVAVVPQPDGGQLVAFLKREASA